MGLAWVPPRVSRELEQERIAAYARVAVLTDYMDTMRDFNVDLARIDPNLSIVKAKESAEPGSGIRAGYWHVLRMNPGAPPSWFVVEGPDGEYIEPTSQIFDRLAGWMDLQSPAVERRRREREEAIVKARERHEAEERRRWDEEVTERYNALNRTQVSMTDVPWSQTNSPTAKRARGKA